ncbi:hypothetical protein [Nocardia sp. NPDC057353]|uniref:hypothetical protein n=1 Tax=Nocardia sp. NPDC057353 TaxID=3346104 RepID=UPI00363B7BED
MEHVEDGAESIGAMLSDIAESLREVSRKLDLVAARVDLPLPVPVPGDDRDVVTRLATIEAWAFRTDRDVADLGRRLDTLQSVADAPGTGRRHAPEPGGRRSVDAEGASAGGRRRAIDVDEVDAGQQAGDGPSSRGRRAAVSDEDAAVRADGGPPARLGRRAAADDGSASGEAPVVRAERAVEESRAVVPPRRRAAENGPADAGLGVTGDEPSSGLADLGNGSAPSVGRRAAEVEDRADTNAGRRAAEVSADPAGAGRRAAETNGTGPAGAGRRAAETNGTGPGADADVPRRRAAEHSAEKPGLGADDAGAPGRRAAGNSENHAAERPASAYGPTARGTQPGSGSEASGEISAPRVPRPRYAAGSSRRRIAEARAESAGRLAADQGETSTPAHLSADPSAQPTPVHLSTEPGAQPDPAQHSAEPVAQPAPAHLSGNPGAQPAHRSTERGAQPNPAHLSADPGAQPAAIQHAAERGPQPLPPRRVADPAETAVSPRLSADPGTTPPIPRRSPGASEHLPTRLPAEPAAPSADEEPAGPGLRAAVEARRASGRLPQRGAAPSPTPPGATPSQTPATPEHTELTGSGEQERWSGPRRNGTSLGLGETVAAAYDQGLRDGFTGQQDGYRQAPAADYPLAEQGDDFAPFADRQTGDAHTEQVGRPGLTSGAGERPGYGEAPAELPGYGDFGTGLTGATAEETAHADKVQAMLDELKRTAAAMPFGPPTGEQDRR